MKTSILSAFTVGFFCSTIFLSCTSQSNLVNASNASIIISTDEVSVEGGKIRGIFNQEGSVEIYAGIPFAAPPIGDLRWKEPQDVIAWDGVLEADSFAPMAMQNRNSWLYTFLADNFVYHRKDATEKAPMSEDCLYLNIWKPAETPEENLPVMVYIHGGSLSSGSSYFYAYLGETMAKQGIIFVTVAYRLNIFGYLALPELASESPNGTTGNYGLLDQIKALEWVKNNISAFGGDSENITIAGESAGSSSVNALCASPLAKGLFRRAIAESSSIAIPVPPHTFKDYQSALKSGEDVLREFNVSTVEELRSIPAEKLLKTKVNFNSMTLDGYALTKNVYQTYIDGENNEEALLNGFNAKEANAFTLTTKMNVKKYNQMLQDIFGDNWVQVQKLYPAKNKKQAKAAYNEIFSAYNFAYGHYLWSNVLSQNAPVWEYYFSKENKGLSCWHSGELIYAYGNIPNLKIYTQDDRDLSAIMVNYWVNFAKTGNPNAQNLPEWKMYSDSPDSVLQLDTSISMIQDPYLELYKIIDKTQNRTQNSQEKEIETSLTQQEESGVEEESTAEAEK